MIYAIIVTHNRKALLSICVKSVCSQTVPVDKIIIIDNASTDDTETWASQNLRSDDPRMHYVRLNTNKGGAGGFAEGIEIANKMSSGWTWMMDDDAEPYPNALAELMKIAVSKKNVYGSLAVKGVDTSWTTTLIEPVQRVVEHAADIPERVRVQSLPFLGFLIHSDLVKKIGLPDSGYFIAADDIEYCMRAERAGAQLIVAGKSRIEHPKSDRYEAKVFGHRLICLRLPPWKRYYDTRNRLFIARKYYGFRLLTQTIPGSFVRLFAALRHEPRKLAQLGAFSAGMIDGLLGIKGRRHAWWRIPQ